jgi:DNA repair exonuclease SbcCD ATPase subunit
LTSLLLAAVTAVTVAPAQGQTTRSGGDNVRAMQELQQLAAERTAQQAENAKLKDEVADLNRRLEKATAEAAAVSARAKQSELAAGRGAESSKQANDALDKSRAQMQELIARFRETALDLKAVETDRNTLRGQLEARGPEYDTCVEHNEGLYEVGREALDRLDRHGFLSKVSESEPFTQLARARLNNLIDDYRQRLEELRLKQSNKAVAGKSP